jgi:tricarballylate dehydrogenase
VGGNATYSGGLFLFAHGGAEDVLPLLSEGSQDAEIEPYSRSAYAHVLETMAEGRADRDLVDVLVDESLEAMYWLADHGVRFVYASGVFGTYVRDTRIVVTAGAALESSSGGVGLVRGLHDRLRSDGVDLELRAPVADLVRADGPVTGVVLADGRVLSAKSIVLTSGGFEASAERRRRYLGPAWGDVKVRGTRHNTGALLDVALRCGAAAAGDLAACHAISVDAGAANPPRAGVPTPARMSRGFRFGVVVNADGERFFDEGADVWTRIYSKMGTAILAQPGAVAFHLFDQRVAARVAAAIPDVAPLQADSVADLAVAAGIDPVGLSATVAGYNAAVDPDRVVDFDRLDGCAARGLPVPKSNWAQPLDRPPFLVYPARAGITFTHGGLAAHPDGRVRNVDGGVIPGLYAAGEITGGLFFGNYPGGSSLMRSAVFGRRAGVAAAANAVASAGRSDR